MKFVFWLLQCLMSFYSFELWLCAPEKKEKLCITDREKRISSIIIQKRPKIPCLLQHNKKWALGGLATNICKVRLPMDIYSKLILKAIQNGVPAGEYSTWGLGFKQVRKISKHLSDTTPKCGNVLAFTRTIHSLLFGKMGQGPLICLTLLGPSVLHVHRSLALENSQI